MTDYKKMSLNGMISHAITENWNRVALADIGGCRYQFGQVAELVEKIHILLESAGVERGDKVAICGRNSANWAAVFIATITYGAVAVPILHEFKPDMVQHLVNHSESKMLFVDKGIWEHLDENMMPNLLGAVYIVELGMPCCRVKELADAREHLNLRFGEKYPRSFSAADVHYEDEQEESLAVINYTSGSTGMSKGVMLPYRSIRNNVLFSIENEDFLKAGDGMVNMLPLAHMYGLVIEMLHPFCKGCNCNFLTKLPSPKVIMSAFAQVRPKLIITVPLILEKIIQGKVFPMLEEPKIKLLLHLPVIDRKVLAKVRAGLMNVFGGQLQELIIGGAPLNPDVAAFLRRINFPVTVGYGMTECGPMISYAPWHSNPPRACGRPIDGMEVRVDSPDPAHVPGDLWVKGVNVMKGYYHNEEATREVMPDDSGWMNTGDMCTVSPDGFITISGRSKTMILGPSGQNIYPEEIEQKLNNMPYVAESLVIEDGGKLVALLHPDYDAAIKDGIDTAAIRKKMEQNLAAANKELPAYSKLSGFQIMEEEFEKTPKRSIKRFLYQKK